MSLQAPRCRRRQVREQLAAEADGSETLEKLMRWTDMTKVADMSEDLLA